MKADYQSKDPRTGQPIPPVITGDSTLFALNDNFSETAVIYSSSKHSYSGFLSLFFQTMYANRDTPTNFSKFILYPISPSTPGYGSKAVNRTVFPKDKVVLRIFYTQPSIKIDD
jgi:hypothetical protein